MLYRDSVYLRQYCKRCQTGVSCRRYMNMNFGNFCGSLWRKKTIVTSALHDTKLKRNLGLVDLIGLGLGSTLGLGVYIITSYAITNEAGPSFVISVIIAGVASLFAGLCYGEFAARLPRCGSAYLYTYVTLGELCGFVIGWNMILEHILSAAIAAKAWSHYLDFMLNGTVQSTLTEHLGWTGSSFTADHPDLLAFSIVIIITLLIATGAKATSTFNLMLVFFNVLIIMCFVCVGYFHVKHENWTNSPGFFAHGFSGVLRGAATLFFSFANFEVMTSASEETREPSKNIPSAIMYSVFACSLVYFCVSTAATLSLHCFSFSGATLPEVLQTLNIHGASSVIAVGGIIGLTASLIGACFYVPRNIYAMSNDRILFHVFSNIGERTQVPVYAVLFTGSVSSILALVARFEVLLELVSLGTLLAYTTVSVCIICLRYQSGTVGLYMEYEDPDDLSFVQCTDFSYADFHLDAKQWKSNCPHSVVQKPLKNGHSKLYCEKPQHSNGFTDVKISNSERNVSFEESTPLTESSKYKRPKENTYTRMESVVNSTPTGSISGLIRIPSDVVLDPNESTWRTAAIGILTFICTSIFLCIMTLYVDVVLHLESWWILLIGLIFTVLLITATVLIAKQPQNRTKLYFQTPYVPFVPLLCILTNIFLLASLPQICWIRFLLWMALGLAIYFCYGFRHSLEKQCDEQEVILYEITDDTSIAASS